MSPQPLSLTLCSACSAGFSQRHRGRARQWGVWRQLAIDFFADGDDGHATPAGAMAPTKSPSPRPALLVTIPPPLTRRHVFHCLLTAVRSPRLKPYCNSCRSALSLIVTPTALSSSCLGNR